MLQHGVLIWVALLLVVNEATSWEIEKSALIASPAAAGFVPHQQSTNAAATRRDLQYKRHARNPRTIIGDSSILHEKRILPGQINSLKSSGEDDLYNGRDTFQAPRIVYVNTKLPEPFSKPEQRESNRVFGFNNFLTKDGTLKSPRRFGFQNDAVQNSKIKAEVMQTDKPQTNENIPVVSQQLAAMIAADLRDESSQAYALYHRIIKEEDGNSPASFEENSVSDDDPSAPRNSENLDDELPADWDVSEAQPDDSSDFSLMRISIAKGTREGSDSDDSKYEFGYRVIDQAAGSDYGHEETHRPEGGVTNGRYHVRLPDGRIQRVEYSADHRGYRAEVSYIPGQ